MGDGFQVLPAEGVLAAQGLGPPLGIVEQGPSLTGLLWEEVQGLHVEAGRMYPVVRVQEAQPLESAQRASELLPGKARGERLGEEGPCGACPDEPALALRAGLTQELLLLGQERALDLRVGHPGLEQLLKELIPTRRNRAPPRLTGTVHARVPRQIFPLARAGQNPTR